MAEPCPRCQQAIPPDAPGGQCPACLLGLLTAPPAPPDNPGAAFGEYELGAEIARGAMGRVVEARHRRLDRAVALKMVHAGRFASPALVERFRLEAGVAARLDHPHIVPVYEVGEQDGVPFLSMRHMTGGSLRDRLAAYPAQPRVVAALVADLAGAVHFAHQRGVIHRDLKPANILLDDEGRACVADFGLAKLLEHDSGLSQTGAVLGSPGYMAPEQARGDQDQVSTASDIYGLGAILYHLLTGRPPHQADTALATLRLVLDEEIARPSRLNPRVDRDLEGITLKCLEKDPARRYASAHALARDLRRWLEGKAVEARPAGPARLLWKWARRHPVHAALTAGLALAGVALFAAALQRQQQAPAEAGASPGFMAANVWVPPRPAAPADAAGPAASTRWIWRDSDGRKIARVLVPPGAKAVRVQAGDAPPLILKPDPEGWVEFELPAGADAVRVEW